MPHYSELCEGYEGVSVGDLLARVLQAATGVSVKNSHRKGQIQGTFQQEAKLVTRSRSVCLLF